MAYLRRVWRSSDGRPSGCCKAAPSLILGSASSVVDLDPEPDPVPVGSGLGYGINHFRSGSGQSGSGMNLIPNFSVKK